MILNDEQLVDLQREMEASNYLAAYKNRLRDLFNTIADLKLQLAGEPTRIEAAVIEASRSLEAAMTERHKKEMAEAVLAESEWWDVRDGDRGLDSTVIKQQRLAANQEKVRDRGEKS